MTRRLSTMRLLAFAALIVAGLTGSHAAEGRRVAVVVGVSDYGGAGDLLNPAHDAAAMTDTLRRLGFETHTLVNSSAGQVEASLQSFGQGGSIGTLVVFFSGHGLRSDGESMLAFGPSHDAVAPPAEGAVQSPPGEALTMTALLTAAHRLKPSTTLLILDACRSDAGAAAAGRHQLAGLAAPPRTTGTYFAYAAAPGDIAFDGSPTSGPLSPFTAAIVDELLLPGQDIGVVMRHVRERVSAATGGRQIPWSEDALTIELILNAAPTAPQLFALYGPALRGDAAAQRELGLAYLNGVGTNRDVERGAALLDQAARSDVTAMLALGAFELTRDVNSLNPGGRAHELYARAAAAGSPDGMFRLAEFARKTAGDTLPSPDTISLYRRAMQAGHADARRVYLLLNLHFAFDKSLSRSATIAALREIAAAGNAQSALELGRLYSTPGLPETDFKEADFWLARAVAAGLPDGLLSQAKLLGEGRGRPVDAGQSYRLTREAAERGSAEAMLLVGRMLQQGKGVAPDPGEAVTWFRRATNAGWGEAFADLGVAFEKGSGVDQSLEEAVALYRRGAALADPVSTRSLAVMYEQGLGVRRNMDRAIELYQTAASLGDSTARGALAVLANNGMLLGSPDTTLGAAAFKRLGAADRSATDTFRLAQMTEKGVGRRADPAEAARLYRQAADAGNAFAATELGVLYKLGKGVPKDLDKAAALWRTASAAGDAVAYSNLAILYRQRARGRDDAAEAGRWSRRGAEAGEPEAMVMHARNLLFGQEGQGRDVDGAFDWLAKSLAAGNGWAAGTLAGLASGTLKEPAPGLLSATERDRALVVLARAGHLEGNPLAQEALRLVFKDREGVDMSSATKRNLERKLDGPQGGMVALLLGIGTRDGRFGAKPDAVKADAYFRQSAQHGEPQAFKELGDMQLDGRLPGANAAEAARWFEQGAMAGDPAAMSDLGVLYRKGIGVPVDGAAAFRQFKAAADLGFAGGMYNLALSYQRGIGTPVDDGLAEHWFERAVAAGFTDAKLGLAVMLINAPEDRRDYARALFNLWSAANDGNTQAVTALREVCDSTLAPAVVRLRATALLDRLGSGLRGGDAAAALKSLVDRGVLRKTNAGWSLTHGASSR